MDELSRKFSGLVRVVSKEVHTRDVPLDSARRRFLTAPRPARRLKVWAVTLSFAAALACLGIAFAPRAIAPSPPHSLVFVVGDSGHPGVVGQWIAADSGASLDVRFSEGTTLTLRPGARARVTDAVERGAAVLLEKGTLDLAVRHVDSLTSWAVHAGPFDVRVTGTQFAAAWDPTSETFDLTMREGSVLVHGPQLDTGRFLRAGEHLHVAVREGLLEVRAAPSTSAEVDAAPSVSPASPTPEEAAGPAPAAPSSAVAEHTPTPSYERLVAAGRFDDALAAADRAGFGTAIEHGSYSDVAALAEAARLGGRPAQARDALLALRKRFGAKGSSAFLLGKIAAEHGVGDAASWFETYLREEPQGALVEQAMGRLMELRKRGDPDGARAIAQRYLERFPHGFYAPLARSLVAP